MTYNAASRKDIRTAEKAQQFDETIDREVICGLMSISNGRAWVYESLARSFVFADPFSHDSNVHAYQAGQRSAGLKLFNSIILYVPSQFTTMIEEAHVRTTTADERTRKPNGDGRDSGSIDTTDSEPGLFDSYGGDSGDETRS